MKKPILKVHFNCIRQKQHGSVIVEFALVIIPLLLIVAGIIEFGRSFWYYDALVKSTRDAARYVSNTRVSSTIGVDSTVKENAKTMVLNAVNSANVPAFSTAYVNVVCDPEDCIAPNYVTVGIINYPLTIGAWFPIVFYTGVASWDVTLSPSTTMRYMK